MNINTTQEEWLNIVKHNRKLWIQERRGNSLGKTEFILLHLKWKVTGSWHACMEPNFILEKCW